ncbi:MAG: AMP-binding protein [Acidimicrobiia bacterium]|nr:AMP-binding protein [Acidimicrobiia bacterium]
MGLPFGRLSLAVKGDVTLGHVLERLAAHKGDRPLVEEADGGLCLTYAQAAKRVRRWGGGIAARVEPGERVVVATPNGYEMLLLCLAASRAGAIPVPLNPALTASEIDHVIADSDARLVVRAAAEVDGAEPLSAPVPVDPGAIAALFYTSGTTGSPKGVELSHHALVGSMVRGAALPPVLTGRLEAVLALPTAHIMGFAALLGMACAGIPVYLLPKFNPVRVLDAIEERRAQVFIGVPAMFRMLLEAGAEDRDLRCVRVWATGADAMPSELAARFKKMGATASLPFVGSVGQATFVEGYGMVELGGGAAAKISPPFLGVGLGADAFGFPLPGYSFRVLDPDTGEQLGPGQSGELLIKGPGVTSGYWGDADATAATVDDGWLRTGDLARLGPFGTVLFEGRAKDVIKVGGYSVYALEVEKAIEQHPDVLEAAVVPLPDAKTGEVPGAVLRLRAGAALDEEEMTAFAKDRLADYKVPRRWLAVDELPRTGTDKVKRRDLVTLFDD